MSLSVLYNSALTAIGATDKLLLQAAGAFDATGLAGGAILINTWNGGFHIVNSGNTELCTSVHPPNLQYLTDSTVSIAGAGSAALTTVTTAQCLDLLGSCSPNAALTAASFFIYDGSTEANAPAGLTCKGFQQGDSAWVSVGGSAAAKDLGTHASGATHHKYFGISVSPTSNGAKTATLKVSMTFV